MNFEFEDFVIREVGHEQRTMQTSKKVNNVLTDVTIFQVKGLNESFDLLYCVGKNGDSWVVAEKIESLSHHLHRAQRTRMSIEKFKGNNYCRLWQEVKKGKDWSQTKKSLPLSEFGKYSKNPIRKTFSELGAKIGTFAELVDETNQNRKQYALLFSPQEIKVPLCAYLLTRILPLI
ncbi:hypothetical protein [Lactococcus cremoris]|uniref:hypothetical protein n=1 Tax=Lactococcus lactis subsp. cremoris TaxID=1359 RepID=UPI000E08F0C3|nr:hypothetical protein [Lactococcus cremoris]RDG22795.1 hypothetical protein DQM05_07080 [Lactococcus cremoris]